MIMHQILSSQTTQKICSRIREQIQKFKLSRAAHFFRVAGFNASSVERLVLANQICLKREVYKDFQTSTQGLREKPQRANQRQKEAPLKNKNN